MINIIYELLYVFTAAAGLLASLSKPLGLGKAGFFLLVFQLSLTSLFVIFKNTNLLGKLISAGIFSSLSIFFFIMTKYKAFEGKAFDEYRFLWVYAIALAAFILGELLAYFRTFGNIVASIAFLSLIPLMFLKVDTNKLFVASVFSLAIIILAKETQIRWKKHGDTELKKHISYISPFIILTVVLILVAPISKTPYKWYVVRFIYKNVNTAIQNIKIKNAIHKDTDYAISLLDFSDEGNLNGRVYDSSNRTLTVAWIPAEMNHLKLSGKNFSTFNGREWIDDDNDTSPDSMFDTMGVLAAVDDYTDNPDEFARWENIYIEYLQMNTEYVFAPAKSATQKSRFPVLNEDIRVSGDDIRWPETKTFKTKYTLTYLLVNSESEEYVDFINNCKKPSEESYNRHLSEFGVKSNPDYSYEKFLTHQEYIHAKYTKEVVLSDELSAYMDELLKGCDTDYEKLLRIEELLKSFEYTKTPGKLPSYVTNETEFLDYFIFESREGYCNFFATAFVLLARSQGIPARYVQGYSTPTNNMKSMYIYSNMAHAWPEVYFDNAGWTAFEPTPGYDGGSFWDSSASASHMPPYGQYSGGNTETNNEEDSNLPDLPELETKKPSISSVRWYTIVIPIASPLVLIVLLISISKIISSARFNKMSDDRKFIIVCRQIFTILKLLGRGIRDDETISEYKQRLEKDYKFDRLSFMNDLETILYSSKKESSLYKEAGENALKIRKGYIYELRKKSLLGFVKYHIRYW